MYSLAKALCILYGFNKRKTSYYSNLKPKNILVFKANSRITLVVIDFGLTKFYNIVTYKGKVKTSIIASTRIYKPPKIKVSIITSMGIYKASETSIDFK